MENGSKKIGLRMALGILAAITIISAVFVSGIQLPGIQAQTGKLNIYLKDAPVEVNALWINMTELQVHRADDGEGEWIPIDISAAILENMGENYDYLEFDLLQYQNKEVLTLSEAEAYTGTYDKIRLTVTGAEAWNWTEDLQDQLYNDEGYPVEEGTDDFSYDVIDITPLRVPPNRIDVIIDFTIETEGEVTVIIDMQPDWIAISTDGNLRPVMKATVEYNGED